MKKIFLIVFLISLCVPGLAADFWGPYDPGAARSDLSNVSGAVELTLSQKVKAAWAEITGNIYASGTLRVDGQITTGTGTAAAPAYSTTGDTNTGIYFPAADTVGISAGGAEKMRVTSGGDVLIGTTTDVGDYKLQVAGNQYVSGVSVLKKQRNIQNSAGITRAYEHSAVEYDAATFTVAIVELTATDHSCTVWLDILVAGGGPPSFIAEKFTALTHLNRVSGTLTGTSAFSATSESVISAATAPTVSWDISGTQAALKVYNPNVVTGCHVKIMATGRGPVITTP